MTSEKGIGIGTATEWPLTMKARRPYSVVAFRFKCRDDNRIIMVWATPIPLPLEYCTTAGRPLDVPFHLASSFTKSDQAPRNHS